MNRQSNSNIFARLRAWLRALDEQLEVKKQKLDDEQYFREHVIMCVGCKRKPIWAMLEENNSYHITCVTPECKDPHWLDCTILNRSLQQALNEWFTLNTGQSLN